VLATRQPWRIVDAEAEGCLNRTDQAGLDPHWHHKDGVADSRASNWAKFSIFKPGGSAIGSRGVMGSGGCQPGGNGWDGKVQLVGPWHGCVGQA